MLSAIRLVASLCVISLVASSHPAVAADPWLHYQGESGPGEGKHIVLIAGEEAYRSELSMPMMARILARQGFECTVLFATDKSTGAIDPRVKDNIPGLEALKTADLMVAFLRWRELPDSQMRHIIEYTESGRPIVGIRNATHPFRYKKNPQSKYAAFDSTSDNPKGGWGRAVLGETWVKHYGKNLVESTRCEIASGMQQHPILRGVRESFWIPDDVYGVSDKLAGDSKALLMGQPLENWSADSPPVADKPPIPIAWTKSYTGEVGKAARIFTSTVGHGDAFKSEDFRRMIANSCFWCLRLEDQINPIADMSIIGHYAPGPAGVGGLKLGVHPDDEIYDEVNNVADLNGVADVSAVEGDPVRAYMDDAQPGWVDLGKDDFAKVNSSDSTWTWKDGVLHCTGQPISVMRTAKQYKNVEIVVEWMHEKPAGNSGLFVWVTPESVEKLTAAGKPGLPDGIEVQMLDHGYTDMVKAKGGKTDWFGTNGDVFAVRVEMKPFPPLSPNGNRSFPRKHLANGHGEWNQYYVRAINGELRLWVNGEEVSGGTGCNPKQGYLCLESEGSPIQFRKIRVRELP